MLKILKATLFAALVLGVTPSVAQNSSSGQSSAQATPKAAGATNTKPASQELLNQMMVAASVSTCEIVIGKKVSFQDAMIANAAGIAYVIQNFHGGRVEGAPNKLEFPQLVDGTGIRIILFTKGSTCYPKLVDSDKKFIDDAAAKFDEAVKKSSNTK